MKLKKRMLCLILVFAVLAVIPVKVNAISEEDVKAPAAILVEPKTGKVLYEKNSHEKRACASITKVMTLLLVMEALDSGKISLDDMVTASAHAASMGGSDIWLKEGETMTVDDLLKSTVIMSANDAAVALAEYLAGTEDDFVNLMNARAKELGMNDTTFKNCNGLDEDGHLTSAYDIALMSAELMKHEKIFDYTMTWIDYVRDGKTQLVNTNKLLKSYQGITGLKTGTTGAAGSCISATAKKDDMELIAVVLGCANTADRFSSASTLLDYGFANWTIFYPEIPELEPITVQKGMQTQVEVKASDGGSLLIPKGKEGEVKSEIVIQSPLTAPVENGQKVGEIIYKLEDEVLNQVAIYTEGSVSAVTFFNAFSALFKQLICV